MTSIHSSDVKEDQRVILALVDPGGHAAGSPSNTRIALVAVDGLQCFAVWSLPHHADVLPSARWLSQDRNVAGHHRIGVANLHIRLTLCRFAERLPRRETTAVRIAALIAKNLARFRLQ